MVEARDRVDVGRRVVGRLVDFVELVFIPAPVSVLAPDTPDGSTKVAPEEDTRRDKVVILGPLRLDDLDRLRVVLEVLVLVRDVLRVLDDVTLRLVVLRVFGRMDVVAAPALL